MLPFKSCTAISTAETERSFNLDTFHPDSLRTRDYTALHTGPHRKLNKNQVTLSNPCIQKCEDRGLPLKAELRMRIQSFCAAGPILQTGGRLAQVCFLCGYHSRACSCMTTHADKYVYISIHILFLDMYIYMCIYIYIHMYLLAEGILANAD